LAKSLLLPRKLTIAYWIVTVWLAVSAIVFLWEQNVVNSQANFYGKFIQLCFGSWPSQLPFDRHSFWFALGASARLILIVGAFGGIVGIFGIMLRERKAMKLADLLSLRERLIRDGFLKQMSATDAQKEEYARLYRRIEQQADEQLLKQLARLFGNKEAKELLELKQAAEKAELSALLAQSREPVGTR
jgi:hypothetical protein